MSATPTIKRSYDLLQLLLKEPGLKLPSILLSENVTCDDLAMLGDDELRCFLRLGSAPIGSWHQPYIISRICHVLQVVEDHLQSLIEDGNNAQGSPELLSNAYYKRIEEELSREVTPGIESFSHREELLRPFVEFLLDARRNWMYDNLAKWYDEPKTVLEARCHSCLMTMKEAQLRGLIPHIVMRAPRWLEFDCCEIEIGYAVMQCEKAFPRRDRLTTNDSD